MLTRSLGLQPDRADVTQQLGRLGCLPWQRRVLDLAGVLHGPLADCPVLTSGNRVKPSSCCCRMQSYINHDGTAAIASIGSELSQIAVADVEEVGVPAISLTGSPSALYLSPYPCCASLV